MPRLSLLALCSLAVLATAAPVKRSVGDEASSAIAAKIAYGSLKSATEMMQEMDDSYGNEDYGTKLPAISNADLTFPSPGSTTVEQNGSTTQVQQQEPSAPEPEPSQATPSPTHKQEKKPEPSKSQPSAQASSAAPSPTPSHKVQNNPLSNLPLVGGLLSGGGLL